MRRVAQSNEPAHIWYEADFFRKAIPSELLYGAAQHHQLAVGSIVVRFALRVREVPGSIPVDHNR